MTAEEYVLRILRLKPRSKVKKAFQLGLIKLNGKCLNRNSVISTGDELTILAPDLYSEDAARSAESIQANPQLQIAVLFENRDYLFVNKPGGVHVHPHHPSERDTVLNGVVAHYPEVAQLFGKPLEGGLVHRLDQGTSGVLCIARHQAAWTAAKRLFEEKAEKQVQKIYLAWVQGNWRAGQGNLELCLRHHPKNKAKMQVVGVNEGAFYTKTSILHFWNAIDKLGHACTLLLIQLHTGVTHQIRVSLASLGFPIIGDALYEKTKIISMEDAAIKPLSSEENALAEQKTAIIEVNQKGVNLNNLKSHQFFLHALSLKMHDLEISAAPVEQFGCRLK